MKKILYNGNVYRVRYERIVPAKNGTLCAGMRACGKCAFDGGENCLLNGVVCSGYNKHDRHGKTTHYAYFRRTNPNSPWPDIAIGLVGLAIAVLLGLICSK